MKILQYPEPSEKSLREAKLITGEPMTELHAIKYTAELHKMAINGDVAGLIVIGFRNNGDVFYQMRGRINKFTALGIVSIIHTKWREMLHDWTEKAGVLEK